MVSVIYTLVSVILVSLMSLVGVAFVPLRQTYSTRLLHLLLCFAVGVMIGNVTFDLLPEAVEQMNITKVSLLAAIGFVAFVLIELVLHRSHRLRGKSLAWMNILADGAHNFIDGVLIAAAFILTPSNPHVGIATTLAVILHEIPQEMGDYAIFISVGYSRFKALLLNFLSALTAVVGAVMTLFFSSTMQTVSPLFLPIAAGGFVYLAIFGLLPLIFQQSQEHEGRGVYSHIVSFLVVAIGFFFIYLFTAYFHH